MRVGIIDADLLGRKKHRFPNLVCEKLSSYWKAKGAEVILIQKYENITDPMITLEEFNKSYINTEMNNINLFPLFDKIYVSKVFTDSLAPLFFYQLISHVGIYDNQLIQNPIDKIQIGGTGFFFEKAPNLPLEIEHTMPDYNLYNEWIENNVLVAKNEANINNENFNEYQYRLQFKEYVNCSIGFLTRGCFRKCQFCVNQKYDHTFINSPLLEFYDSSRPKICLLDDNFFGNPNWKKLLQELIDLKKPFKFKQGLDERLLTEEKCQMLFRANYDGDIIFAFDNFSDYNLIEEKLKIINKYRTKKNVKFYVLTSFESTDIVDVRHTFARLSLLFQNNCLAYIMRYQNKDTKPYLTSEFKDIYVTLARWCNQASMQKTKSFREYCELDQLSRKNALSPAIKGLQLLESLPEEVFPHEYLDMKYNQKNTINIF